MSDEIVIKVKDISKNFKLYNSPRRRLLEAIHPFRKKYHKNYNALKNVSFEIKKGESVGVLGKNGAGKSTLLKILTGVQIPTSGEVYVNGRIAALLELGAGFNPSLTGLENIFFQGAIMGFTREEMNSKLERIIDFAGIGEFINQPVKNYSSGMFARLAFSISINVDPDILIVDEALSVGDFTFQQKCLRELKKLKDLGKCILFVSHDVNAIQVFCESAILLDKGELVKKGSAKEIVSLYQSTAVNDLPKPKEENNLEIKSYGKGKAEIINFSILNSSGTKSFLPGENSTLEFEILCKEDMLVAGLGITIRDRVGVDILYLNNYMYDVEFTELKKNKTIKIEIKFVFPNLAAGKYSVSPAVCEGTHFLNEQQHWIFDAEEILVQPSHPFMSGGTLFIPEATFSFKVE